MLGHLLLLVVRSWMTPFSTPKPRNRYLAGIEPTFSSKHLLDSSKDRDNRRGQVPETCPPILRLQRATDVSGSNPASRACWIAMGSGHHLSNPRSWQTAFAAL
jgi:hypothetical protein